MKGKKMSKNKVSINLGGSGAMMLTLAFFIAKIMGYINWSWWFVFAPLWLGLAIILSVLAVGALGVILFAVMSALLDQRKYKKKRF
jgi:ABC-type antimicrobial peptide transport system permease subunit